MALRWDQSIDLAEKSEAALSSLSAKVGRQEKLSLFGLSLLAND
eukprot:CAMPEP_0194782826 /NCGR_PEP_ID=MMETSP0323_2-20130528/78896_1 /TAXON_ID=2866 ORGANISM="Crypthecodinium cohnii, Strain Seligo" /NCGR_SAMPLE_ID=MMETSP0323_2 /ASSEMBLY_ACC=CAM_ASM_000346 /LENGTH=43 /DNA_ID= /DNA_START= /DNA_END= /DNA_ORIENTATION=